jgi:2-iminobutanoate/2-iminopropanoate deaminase
MKEVVRTEFAPAPFQGSLQAIRQTDSCCRAGRIDRNPHRSVMASGADRTDAHESARDPRGGRQRQDGSSRHGADHYDQGMNEVYARHVGDQPPARSTFQVAKLPPGLLVEIEAIAIE